MTANDWLDAFPALRSMEPEALSELLAAAQIVEVAPETILFREGSPCRSYLMVLDGAVRVQKVSENGREIVLYRVEAGQTCVLTTVCLLAKRNYDAEGIAETTVRAVSVGAGTYLSLMARSDVFRRFVMAMYSTRLLDLMLLVEEVAFGRIDMRLSQFLTGHVDESGRVRRTHQELAVELGTAREVVSRQLKEFERRGWVALHRGRLEILDPAALRRLGESAVP